MFKKETPEKSLKSKKGKDLSALYKIVRPRQLLAIERRQNVINSYLGRLSFSPERYELIAEPLLANVASFLGEIPETRNSYFSKRGGFLDHALSRTEAALNLARDYFVDDSGEAVADLTQPQKLWMYTLFSAALLRGIGRLITDFNISIYDESGEHQSDYQPLMASLLSHQGYYDYHFSEPEPDVFIRRSTLILAQKLMPEQGMRLISSRRQVFAVWLALLEENDRDAGVFGHLLDSADAMAILKYLNEQALSRFAEKRSLRSTTFIQSDEVRPLKEGELPPAGVEFIKWFAQKLASREIIINKSPLVQVPGGMLMNPDIFKLFIREMPIFKNWLNVQKAVMQLGIHKVSADGTTTHRFIDGKTKAMHSGIVISALGVILPEKMLMIDGKGEQKEVSRKEVANANSSLRAIGNNSPSFEAINGKGEQVMIVQSTSPQNSKGGA